MSELIEKFYIQNKLPQGLLASKLYAFERNKDIELEFEYWIKNGKFLQENVVIEKGYSAEKLCGLSPNVNAEVAYMVLIELRENPEKALERIARGFKKY